MHPLKNLYTYIFLISALLFTSCETELAFSYGEVDKYVVVNSTFTPTKEFSVTLSYTRNALLAIDRTEYIEDAIVQLYNEDHNFLVSLEHQGNGEYRIPNLYPLVDVEYYLEVRIDGYSTIKAHSKIPAKANLTNITSEEIEFNGETALKVDFDIEDEDEDDNYYIWEIVSSDDTDANGSQTNSYIPQILHNLNANNSQLSTGGSKLFISGQNGVGSILNSSIVSLIDNSAINSSANPDSPVANEKSFLKVLSASYDHYHYFLSVEQARLNGASLGGSTQEPITIHSNIQGGLGVFAGYNVQYEEL